jgi:hypothetical protein
VRGHRQRRVENGGAGLLAFVQRSGVLGRDGRISKNERSFYFADPGSLCTLKTRRFLGLQP